MLRNKKTVGLLLLVVIVWGIIGYKIYSHLASSDFGTVRKQTQMRKKNDNTAERLHFSLSYADPFLKNVTVEKVELQRAIQKVTLQAKRIPIETKPVQLIDWSLLKYYGVMNNASRAVKTGIVRFDEEDFFVREGDRVDIFTVVDVRDDSIKLRFENSTRYIKKQN